MQKHLSFCVTAAVLLTAIVTVTLYTVNAVHAQYNKIWKPPVVVTKQKAYAMPMTNATAGAAKNMTGGVGLAKSSEVSIVKGASNPGITEPFNPSPLTVSVGTAVTWTNHDSTGHTVTEGNPSGNTPANGFDSGILAPGKTFTHTFATAGAIQYYCTLHPTMLGEVIVK